MHYETSGSGLPVVLLHGMASSSRSWNELIPEFARAGFKAYAPDLPGHGGSAKPGARDQYQIEAIFDQLETWIAGLQLPAAPVLIGHSLGGLLSLAYAMRHPDQVQGLVLINPFYTPNQLPSWFRWLSGYLEWGEKALEMAPSWLIRFIVDLEPYDARHCTRSARTQAAEDASRASPAIVHILASVPDLTPGLADVNCETLILWGDRDLTLDTRYFPRLVSGLPNAHGHAIHGRGHKPHLGISEDTQRLIFEFLSALSFQSRSSLQGGSLINDRA